MGVAEYEERGHGGSRAYGGRRRTKGSAEVEAQAAGHAHTANGYAAGAGQIEMRVRIPGWRAGAVRPMVARERHSACCNGPPMITRSASAATAVPGRAGCALWQSLGGAAALCKCGWRGPGQG